METMPVNMIRAPQWLFVQIRATSTMLVLGYDEQSLGFLFCSIVHTNVEGSCQTWTWMSYYLHQFFMALCAPVSIYFMKLCYFYFYLRLLLYFSAAALYIPIVLSNPITICRRANCSCKADIWAKFLAWRAEERCFLIFYKHESSKSKWRLSRRALEYAVLLNSSDHKRQEFCDSFFLIKKCFAFLLDISIRASFRICSFVLCKYLK